MNQYKYHWTEKIKWILKGIIPYIFSRNFFVCLFVITFFFFVKINRNSNKYYNNNSIKTKNTKTSKETNLSISKEKLFHDQLVEEEKILLEQKNLLDKQNKLLKRQNLLLQKQNKILK